MEKHEEEIILSLLDRDDELKVCYDKHLEFEKQLNRYQKKIHLSVAEEVEKKRIQKLKLAGKDRMMQIVDRYR